jgi:flagellin
VPVDATHDSISSLVSKINLGAQARGTINFGTMTSTQLAALSLTVHGQIFAFTTTDTALTYNGTIAASTIGVQNLNDGSMTSVALQFAAMMNANYSSTGVFAAVNGSTVQLYSATFGEAGNQISMISSTTSGITMSGPNLTGGGAKVFTADAYFDEANQEYELQVKADIGGDAHQIRFFTLTSLNGHGDVIGSTSSVGYLGTLTTNYSGTNSLANYSSTDNDLDWTEAQNGSGDTAWDGRDIRTQSGAQLALAALDSAINRKDVRRAELGAFSNRLENTITNLQIQAENLQAAESRISDVDVAQEMTEYTRNNILAQAAVSMLAQANSLPQLALKLLGG